MDRSNVRVFQEILTQALVSWLLFIAIVIPPAMYAKKKFIRTFGKIDDEYRHLWFSVLYPPISLTIAFTIGERLSNWFVGESGLILNPLNFSLSLCVLSLISMLISRTFEKILGLAMAISTLICGIIGILLQ